MSFPIPSIPQTAMAVSVILSSVAICPAHQGDFVSPIYKLPPGAIDLQDGHLWDWEDMTPGASLSSPDFDEVMKDQTWEMTSPEEIAFQVYLGWVQEEQRVYVGVEIFDDIYFNEWDGTALVESWFADHVEFYIDGDHSGGEYNLIGYTFDGATEEQKRATNSTAQHYWALAESPTGSLARNIGPADTWVSTPPWTEAGGSVLGRTQGLSVIEFAVTPWDDLDWRGASSSRRSDLTAGKVIGMQLMVVDWDEGGALGGFHSIHAPFDPWWNASMFVDAVLCGRDACLPGSGPVSSVSSDSWGRIKASFR